MLYPYYSHLRAICVSFHYQVTLLTAAVSQSGLYGIGASGMSLMQQEMMTAAAIQSSNALQSNPNSVYLYDMSLAPNQATVQPQPHVTSATQLQNQQAAANAASASMGQYRRMFCSTCDIMIRRFCLLFIVVFSCNILICLCLSVIDCG